jgi:hypothetical protein
MLSDRRTGEVYESTDHVITLKPTYRYCKGDAFAFSQLNLVIPNVFYSVLFVLPWRFCITHSYSIIREDFARQVCRDSSIPLCRSLILTPQHSPLLPRETPQGQCHAQWRIFQRNPNHWSEARSSGVPVNFPFPTCGAFHATLTPNDLNSFAVALSLRFFHCHRKLQLSTSI